MPAELEEAEFDSPLGTGTGAAVIFGATGGVMDAALRSAYFLVTGKNPDPDTVRAGAGQQALEGSRLRDPRRRKGPGGGGQRIWPTPAG